MMLGLALASTALRPTGGMVAFNYKTLTAIPVGQTFTRAGNALCRNSSGVLQNLGSNVARFDYDINGNALGLLIEQAITNKVTCRKHNPTDITNVAVSGDVAATLTCVSDSAALAASSCKLNGVCDNGNVYKLDNSAGSTKATATIEGQTGNTSVHTVDAFIRGSGTGAIRLAGGGTLSISPTSNYQRYSAVITSPATTSKMQIEAEAGAVVYFILPGLYQLNYTPAHPIPGNTTAAITKPLDLLTDATSDIGFNPAAGTMIAGFVSNIATYSGTNNVYSGIFEAGNGSTNRLTVYKPNSTDLLKAECLSANVTTAQFDFGAMAIGTQNFVAYTYSSAGVMAELNGGTIYADFVVTLPASFATVNIGGTSGPNSLNGWLTYFAYAPSVLPGFQIRKATGLNPATRTMAIWSDSMGSYTNDSSNVPYYLEQKYPAPYFIYHGGVGGDTSTQVKNRFLGATGTPNTYYRDMLPIFWCGRNNPSAISTIISDINTMIAALENPSRYLVLSPCLTENELAFQTGNYANVVALRAALATQYGPLYLEVQDLVVPGFTTDGQHPNSTATNAIAQRIKDKFDSLGW